MTVENDDPKNIILEDYVFLGASTSTCKLIVPNAAAVTAYSSADGWRDFTDILSATQIIRYTASARVKPDQCASFGTDVTYNESSSTYDGATRKGIIVFDGDVTTIGKEAFRSCTELTSITIPNTVTTIGEYAFERCASLESVVIPNSVTSIGREAFSLTALYKNESNWESNVLYIGNHLIQANSEITGDYTIKEGTLTIANEAFYWCEKLTSVEIPNSVTSIGDVAFAGCSSLSSFTGKFASDGGHGLIDNDNKLIAFAPAELTSYTIPNSVTSIGAKAFCGCSSLTSVTIPNSVTSIGEGVFFLCTGLTSVTVENSNPANISLGDDVFLGASTSTCVLNVPKGSKELYAAADQWSDFTNIVEFDRSYDLTITEAGLATLWLEYDATIPTGVEVYYASSCSDSKVKMTKIEDVLPRETGVIVKGEAGDYTFEEADEAGEEVTSLLVGSATTQTFEETGFMFYKLTYANSAKENLGFYLANNDGTIESKPHKAYLKLAEAPASAPTRGIGIDWGDDDSTEIESIAECDTDGDTMYNLQGMPVGNDYKGIVIKNGRKMMNK